MMLLLLNNPLFSQISWEINLSASNTAPIRNCSPITLTFDLIQAEFDTPMTGVVLELLLLDDVFQIVENAAGFALTTPPNPNVMIGGRSYDVWRLTGVTIPAVEEESTVHLTVVQTGDIDDPAPSVFYRATYGANGTGNQPGPLLITDVTFLEIGTTPASQTLLSDVDEEILPVADVLIRGTLVADVNFDFDGAYRIYMDENALIQVENGVELKFTDQTTMRGNQFNNHQVALQYGWPAPGTFPPIGAQTGIQSHHGNQWLEIYQNGKFGVGHYGTYEQVQASKIEYDPDDEPDPQAVVLTTNEEVPNGSIFRDIAGNTYFCATEPAGCPPPTQLFTDHITEADIHIAKGDIDPGYFGEPQAWVAKRQLYRRLLEDTTLLSADESIEAFFSQETLTSVGIYERLHRDMDQLYVLDPVNESELEGYLDTIMVKVEELHIVAELLNDQQLTSEERDSLLIEKQSLLSTLHTITEDYIGLDTILEVDRISRAASILSDNSNAPVDEDFEINQQTVNRIMLEYITGRQTILTDSQEIALTPIANSCPWSGGPAVYLARAVLDDGAYFYYLTLHTSSQYATKIITILK